MSDDSRRFSSVCRSDRTAIVTLSKSIISAAIKEVMDLNNKGTQLAREGKLDEAISFLEKEAEHVEGFAKECAVVTHYRLEHGPDGRPAQSARLSFRRIDGGGRRHAHRGDRGGSGGGNAPLLLEHFAQFSGFQYGQAAQFVNYLR